MLYGLPLQVGSGGQRFATAMSIACSARRAHSAGERWAPSWTMWDSSAHPSRPSSWVLTPSGICRPASICPVQSRLAGNLGGRGEVHGESRSACRGRRHRGILDHFGLNAVTWSLFAKVVLTLRHGEAGRSSWSRRSAGWNYVGFFNLVVDLFGLNAMTWSLFASSSPRRRWLC